MRLLACSRGRSRLSRILAPDDVRRALDTLGDEVLSGGSLREALRELLRRGLPDADGRRQGLDDLLARAARMRREVTRRGRLDGAVTRAQAQLDQALVEFNEKIKLDPGHASGYSKRADLYRQRKEYDLSVADCDQVPHTRVRFGAPAADGGTVVATGHANRLGEGECTNSRVADDGDGVIHEMGIPPPP